METTVQVTLSNDELHALGFLSRDHLAKAIREALDQITNPEGRQIDLDHIVRVVPDWL